MSFINKKLLKQERMMRDEVKSVTIYTLAGIAAGLLALFQLQGRYMALIGFVVMFGLFALTMKIFKKAPKWFIGNGIWPYIATWYATWVVVYASLHI